MNEKLTDELLEFLGNMYQDYTKCYEEINESEYTQLSFEQYVQSKLTSRRNQLERVLING